MPKRRNVRNGDFPLPNGWEEGWDYDGKVFYINHNEKLTTWIDPRDRYTKPLSFGDCLGNELPYGWEEAYEHKVGHYFINHHEKINQIDDPRLQWREEQELMLKEYLAHAQDDLAAKKEIFTVKQERLNIAEEHLNDTLSNWKDSRTSLNSTCSTASSTKYDPDLLKVEVCLAKGRVQRLHHELQQIGAEMDYKQQGLETLQHVDEKISNQQQVYNSEEAEEIVRKIEENKKMLHRGEKEKQELMQMLAKLKDELLTNTAQSGSSPDVSTLSLPRESFSTACQTDLSGEYEQPTWGEIAWLRLQYDEARAQVSNLQQELANIEDQMIPGQNESDKDRLLLIQEKEQLLRELRSISHKGRSQEEMIDLHDRIKQLEQDLTRAMEFSNKQIADRIQLTERKSEILEKLAEATKLTTQLESKLKSLSVSTLSVSSGSSLGSLGSLSASSKGSLSSLSYPDIYAQSQSVSDVNFNEIFKRIETTLQGPGRSYGMHELASSYQNAATPPSGSATYLAHCSSNSINNYAAFSVKSSSSPGSSLTSLSPPVSPYENGPPPSYEQHLERQQNKVVFNTAANSSLPPPPPNRTHSAEVNVLPAAHCDYTNLATPIPHNCTKQIVPHLPLPAAVDPLDSMNVIPYRKTLATAEALNDATSNPPLSPISESSSGVCNNLSGINTRSVSAAVSDESVAGDSGVFEAVKRPSELDEVYEMSPETAKVQIKLKYEGVEGQLHIAIEQAKNLSALAFPDNCQVCIKVALVPSPENVLFSTQWSKDLKSPKFNEVFRVNIPETKLESKSLQVYVWCLNNRREEDCMGCAQVSLTEFNPRHVKPSWYNVLSFKFMQPPGDRVAQLLEASSAQLRRVSLGNKDERSQAVDGCRDGGVGNYYKGTNSQCGTIISLKEESSDESTIISSQTSTLTRNQGPEDMEGHEDEHAGEYTSESHEEEEEDEEDWDHCCAESVHLHKDIPEESEEDFSPGGTIKVITCYSPGGTIKRVTCDKETNTDPYSVKRDFRRRPNEAVNRCSIRRSQTFSPVGKAAGDYICKLNRSDSDTSVKCRRAPFQRNTIERQSLRLKKPPVLHLKSKSMSYLDRPRPRTSLDLELDYQASQTRVQQLNKDILQLKQIKHKFVEASTKGDKELNWLANNEQLQTFIAETDKLLNQQHKQQSKLEEKAEKMLKKVTKGASQLRHTKTRQPEAALFREKMAFFTTANLSIPLVPSEPKTAAQQPQQQQDVKGEVKVIATTQS